MWIVTGNLAFMGGGFCLYWIARRSSPERISCGRGLESLGCILTALLTIGGFALAHMGMNQSWTGLAPVADLQWLPFALVFVLALLLAHLLLRLQRSRVDQMLLPVVGFLVALGLINIYVWETRDANAYISTVALPTIREYRESIAKDPSLSVVQRTTILDRLDPIPSELEFEGDAQQGFATVLNSRWLETYNESVGRFSALTEASDVEDDRRSVHEVHLYGSLRRQLVAAGVSLLMVPAVVFAVRRLRLRWMARGPWSLYGGGLALLAAAGATAVASGGRNMPALLSVGGQSVVAYEVLKVGLVILLALSFGAVLTRGSGWYRPAALFGFAAAGATVGTMIWLDPGAGIALLGIGTMMLALIVSRSWRWWLVAGGIVAILAAPVAVNNLDSVVPQTAQARIRMWTDPWGAYERADLKNQVAASLARIVAQRAGDQPASLVSAGERRPEVASLIERDVGLIEQELRWRLARIQPNSPGLAEPFVPGSDPVEERLLLEAENLWSGLGGFPLTGTRTDDQRISSLADRIEAAVSGLRAGAERFASDPPEGDPGGLTRPGPRPGSPGSREPDNFQAQRVLFALRAGGLVGVGLGAGRPEAVPAVTEDVALASLGEALGFPGVALITLLLVLITVRSIDMGRVQNRPTAGLLMVGLSSLIGLQALINMGGLLGFLPFTGLTFPFISRSGTSLLASTFAVALIMAMSVPSDGKFRRPPRRRPSKGLPVHAVGLPAAFVLLLAGAATLQLTGRTLAPSSFLAEPPGPTSPVLHAGDQWEAPSYRVIPGPVVDRNGQVLAETKSLGGERVYPDEELAASLGHTLAQLDMSFREDLIRPAEHATDGEELSGARPALITTIDSDIQRVVHEAIDQGATEAGIIDTEGLRGAVVVVDATNGDVLAIESRPNFSPSELSDPLRWVRAEINDRRRGFAHRYLNRAIDGYYPPGSTFKTVTVAAAVKNDLHSLHSPEFDYRSGAKSARLPDGFVHYALWHQLPLSDGPAITDENHPHLWRLNLEEAFAWSCNIAFGEMGLELGADRLADMAQRFGFERPIEVRGLGTSLSTLDNDYGKDFPSRYLTKTDSALARTAFGQGQIRASPLQMALVSAGIANGGQIMQPQVVAGWKSQNGAWLEQVHPAVLSDTGLSEEEVADVQGMMRAAVTYAWAGLAKQNPDNANPGVAGKTGSAQWREGPHATHAWFIGYFPTESPRIAIAAILEQGGSGPTVAVRIAHHIFAAEPVQEYVREAEAR